MSAEQNNNAISTTTITAAEAEPSVHTAAAQARIRDIRSMRDAIPEFVVPASKTEGRRVVTAASVPVEFVELAITALTNVPDVRRATSNPNRARDRMDYADAYSPLADELEATAQFLRHSIRVARNEAGSDALATYELAKRLMTRPGLTELVEYVADMRRALGIQAAQAKAKAARRKAAAAAEHKDAASSPAPPTKP